jgi:hypothetical protein
MISTFKLICKINKIGKKIEKLFIPINSDIIKCINLTKINDEREANFVMYHFSHQKIDNAVQSISSIFQKELDILKRYEKQLESGAK